MQKRTYTIFVNGKRQSVTKKVYAAYHQLRERERYLGDLAAEHERSLEHFAENGVNVEYRYAMSRPSIEDEIFQAQLFDRLYACLARLEEDEKILIAALFFQGKSEQEAGIRLGISQQAVSKRKLTLLAKIKTILEK